MSGPKRYSKVQNLPYGRVLEMRREGYSLSYIGMKLGLKMKQVVDCEAYAVKLECDLARRTEEREKENKMSGPINKKNGGQNKEPFVRKYSDETCLEIATMKDAGGRNVDIAKRLGIHPSLVSWLLRRARKLQAPKPNRTLMEVFANEKDDVPAKMSASDNPYWNPPAPVTSSADRFINNPTVRDFLALPENVRSAINTLANHNW